MEELNKEKITQKAESMGETIVSTAKSWGLDDISQLASAAGLGTLVSLAKRVNWQPIRRQIMSKPVQTAAIVAVGIGAILIVRRMMAGESDDAKMMGEKLHH